MDAQPFRPFTKRELPHEGNQQRLLGGPWVVVITELHGFNDDHVLAARACFAGGDNDPARTAKLGAAGKYGTFKEAKRRANRIMDQDQAVWAEAVSLRVVFALAHGTLIPIPGDSPRMRALRKTDATRAVLS